LKEKKVWRDTKEGNEKESKGLLQRARLEKKQKRKAKKERQETRMDI
jgi:hypothetical protein